METLMALLGRAAAVKDPGPPDAFCRLRAWRPFKVELRAILDRHVRVLGEDYWRVHDEGLRRVLRALPPCRDCRCGTRAQVYDRARERADRMMTRTAGGRGHATGERREAEGW